MMDDVLALHWNYFEDNACNTFKSCYADQDFTDVTLATADDKQIKAHKVILGSCSPFFKNIFINNPHPNPLIYLKDLKFTHVQSVLKFIYLGECEIERKHLQEFLAIGKEFQVEGLLQVEYDEGTTEDAVADTRQESLEEQTFRKPDNENVYDEYEDSEQDNEVEVPASTTRYEPVNEQTFRQPENQNVFEDSEQDNERASWDTTIDGGNKQLADIAPTRRNVDGKYPCDQCQYKATQQGTLKTHKLSVHKGVKYQCDQCEYKATQTTHLMTHKKSIHEGVKYQCDECDYKARFPTNLAAHKKAKHEGIAYSCVQCNFKSSWSQDLSRDTQYTPQRH